DEEDNGIEVFPAIAQENAHHRCVERDRRGRDVAKRHQAACQESEPRPFHRGVFSYQSLSLGSENPLPECAAEVFSADDEVNDDRSKATFAPERSDEDFRNAEGRTVPNCGLVNRLDNGVEVYM